MMTRRNFGFTGASTALSAAAGSSAWAQAPQTATDHAAHAHDDMLAACARACSDCQRECDSCATHCAHMLHEGHKDHLATLGTCRDCADFCSTAAEIVARQGPFAALICDACREACARCGRACEKFPDDEQMKRCAAECRRCEKACLAMGQHVATKPS